MPSLESPTAVAGQRDKTFAEHQVGPDPVQLEEGPLSAQFASPIVLHMPFFHGDGVEVEMVSLGNRWREHELDVTLPVNGEGGPVSERVSERVPVVGP